MLCEVRVDITPRSGIRDPEGAEIERALPALGYGNVVHVTMGKVVRLVLEVTDADAARAQAEEMSVRFLANPVIEDFRVSVEEPVR